MAYYSYDNSKRINLYKQITPTGCAVTCAAMCVRQSPETLRADGFNINVVENWNAIAQRYGYEKFIDGRNSLSGILDILIGGFPAIAKIHDGSGGVSQHWVVITGYTGNTDQLSASQFTCADPFTGTFRKLSDTSYSGIYSSKYLFPLK
jgi:hypothetical protein